MKRITRICFAQRILRALRFRQLFLSIRNALSRAARGLNVRLAVACWALFVPFLATPGASRAQITQLASVPAALPSTGTGAARVESLLDKLPLSFEANKGQFDERVRFLARGQRQNLFLTAEGMVLVLNSNGASSPDRTVIRMEFDGATGNPEFTGLDRLEAISNYFRGNDYTKYITNVPNYARVRQLDIYPGIDVVYYGNHGRLEHDFMVFPGGDVKSIKLRLGGHGSASISDSGDLILNTSAGDLTLHRPVAHQEREGVRTNVPVRYVLAKDRIQFEVGDYDRTWPLIIDPILSYSTFLSGSGNDEAGGIAIDPAGSTYIVGRTGSTDFPIAGAIQKQNISGCDAFVTKLNASGSGIVYSTYLGGRRYCSFGKGIAVDAAGNAYITGNTGSSAFPVTKGAYETTIGTAGTAAGFIAKLNPQGSALVYSTFVNEVLGNAIAIDPNGNAYITGTNATVFKLISTGTLRGYIKVLGGSSDSGNGIAVDSAGHAYVTGLTTSANFPLVNPFQSSLNGTHDAFVAKLDPTGTSLMYSTYLGGSLSDSGNAIAIDAQGNAYVVGTTYSLNFPVLRAFQPFKAYTGTGHENVNQAFITKLSPSGNALVYSSYLGGRSCLGGGVTSCTPIGDEDGALAVTVDAAGSAYMAGYARSVEFPQWDEIQKSPLTPYGESIPFVAKVIDRDLSTVIYSVALGKKRTNVDGRATGIAVDANGNAYVAGHVYSAFPVTAGAFQVTASPTYATAKVVVFKASPGKFTTVLTSSSSAPTSAQTITLTAALNSALPNGTVTFKNNGNTIGTAAVSGWRATLDVSLPAGVQELTAVYSGDNKVSRPLFLPVKQALICN